MDTSNGTGHHGAQRRASMKPAGVRCRGAATTAPNSSCQPEHAIVSGRSHHAAVRPLQPHSRRQSRTSVRGPATHGLVRGDRRLGGPTGLTGGHCQGTVPPITAAFWSRAVAGRQSSSRKIVTVSARPRTIASMNRIRCVKCASIVQGKSSPSRPS